MAAGASSSLPDDDDDASSLLLSDPSSGFTTLSRAAAGPALPGGAGVAPFPGAPLAGPEAARTCVFSEAFVWLGVLAGAWSSLSDSSSLLSETSSGFLALLAGVRVPPLPWGVPAPAFPGVGGALFLGGS